MDIKKLNDTLSIVINVFRYQYGHTINVKCRPMDQLKVGIPVMIDCYMRGHNTIGYIPSTDNPIELGTFTNSNIIFGDPQNPGTIWIWNPPSRYDHLTVNVRFSFHPDIIGEDVIHILESRIADLLGTFNCNITLSPIINRNGFNVGQYDVGLLVIKYYNSTVIYSFDIAIIDILNDLGILMIYGSNPDLRMYVSDYIGQKYNALYIPNENTLRNYIENLTHKACDEQLYMLRRDVLDMGLYVDPKIVTPNVTLNEHIMDHNSIEILPPLRIDKYSEIDVSDVSDLLNEFNSRVDTVYYNEDSETGETSALISVSMGRVMDYGWTSEPGGGNVTMKNYGFRVDHSSNVIKYYQWIFKEDE